MRCIVTAGPTYESLDDVRRLTNFSTGRLGSELAGFLAKRGHDVSLLLGAQATYCVAGYEGKVEKFTTTADLSEHLRALAREPVNAVFHAAAVSDFAFGQIWRRSPGGELTRVQSGKIPTRQGTLLAELVPTAKIIARLRDWYPHSLLVGWKYEVEGDRAGALRQASLQLTECRTDACVANGPAYGPGFGLVRRAGEPADLRDVAELYVALEQLLSAWPAQPANNAKDCRV